MSRRIAKLGLGRRLLLAVVIALGRWSTAKKDVTVHKGCLGLAVAWRRKKNGDLLVTLVLPFLVVELDFWRKRAFLRHVIGDRLR